MYLFNPDHDLALANRSESYTPPYSAVKMTEDLVLLPLWYAPNGSKIVAEGAENKAFLESMKTLFQINVTMISFSEIARFPNEKIVPWGWNPALRKKLLNAYVSEQNTPSIDEIERLYDYSGRQHAVKMLRELKRDNELFCGESHYFTLINDVLRFLDSQSGNGVLKMPHSGSGKGLIWILGEMTDKQIDWVRRVLRVQGGIVAEPVLPKVQDFAMEYKMENGCIRFIGYSLFRTSDSGAYLGNELMSDEEIEQKLLHYIPKSILHHINELLKQKIPVYFPDYNGFLGIDMMICKTERGYQVQPCVEINMRMNMGLVAHIFRERFVAQQAKGMLMVEYFNLKHKALAHHQQMINNSPLIIENGKIKKGYLALTPVNEDTNFVAYTLL